MNQVSDREAELIEALNKIAQRTVTPDHPSYDLVRIAQLALAKFTRDLLEIY